MPAQRPGGELPSYIDETHQRIAEFAEEFLDDDDERASFVDGLLERRGYQRTTAWAPPEPESGGSGRAPLLRQGGQAGGQRPRSGGQGGGQGQGSYFRGARPR